MMNSEIARLIDHTLLKPDATSSQIVKLCAEAREHGFASVCVNPYWVPAAVQELVGSNVKTCTVVGFPLGANATPTKIFEAGKALRSGAQEIDMVINIGELKSGAVAAVLADIRGVVEETHGAGALVKVILETCLLTDAQKVTACQLSVEAGADYVKTSTGFSTGGATVEDVALMRNTVGALTGVKASGGIRSLADLRKMVDAGATRIGTSSGVAIVAGALASEGLASAG
jgi:deoxyribose-phosphate aldolase